MSSSISGLYANLWRYKRRFYFNKLLRGIIFFLALLLAVYLLFATIEYYGNLNTYFRGVFFFGFFVLAFVFGWLWVGEPLFRFFNLQKQISDEEAAQQIGQLLPEVNDKLLNTLQLSRLSDEENELVKAGIAQKSSELSVFNFSDTIKLDQNTRYLPYVLIPLAVIIAILVFIPKFLTDTTQRIVKYNQEFLPEAPFKFIVNNEDFEVFKNEDVEIRLQLEGSSLPDAAYIYYNDLLHKMEPSADGNTYIYYFRKIDKSVSFHFEASGFSSQNYDIQLKARPLIKFFDVKLIYPGYLGKKPDKLSNTGNLLIPEGTSVLWNFNTEDCDRLLLTLNSKNESISGSNFIGSDFSIKKQIFSSTTYSVSLFNGFGTSKEKMEYSITVIPDEYPKIAVEQFKDTTLFNYLVLGGNISDDYGLTELKLFYRRNKLPDFSFTSDFVEQPKQEPFQPINIKISSGNSQSFYFRWDIDSLRLRPGEGLEYFLTVWDNDGIHGRKKANSKSFELKLPSVKQIEESINQSSESAEKQLNTTLSKAEEIKKDVKKLEQRLKGKKTFDWQDKKAIEDLLKKQEAIQQEVEQMKEKHKELLDKKDRFDKTNERLAEKTKLLQQLMNEMLDEETKKLYQELAKLLQEKNKENEIRDVVDKLKNKDQNLEKELDRALEMFKQLKFESKLEDIQQKMEQLAEKQEKLSEKTEEKNADAEKLGEDQKQLNEEFEEMKKEMEELREMNEELENKSDLEDTKQGEKEVSEEQQKSSESLDKKENKKAAKSQKNAAKKMQQMAQQMQQMQQSMESQQMSENIEDLRAILENLIRLSYNQEDVMKEFKKVAQSDPKFVQLSQQQIKLKDDSKIIEDSLYALSKRVFQIQSFITRELDAMKQRMDESVVAIKARRADIAAGKQQMAMTSMNNLALLLSDVLKQMQEQQQEQQQQQANGKGNKKQKGKSKGNKPNLSQMQKNLNKKIDELKKSGMQGKQLSEELSKLARQQEGIRKAMEQEGGSEQGNKEGKDGKDGKNGKEQGQGEIEQLKREMERTESDLVNKQITQEMLNRQQDILNRLLEHEKAQREREQDPQRESQTAKEKPRKIPASFELYLKEKEKQVELLRTIPPSLNPYYKKETNEYFEKLNH